MYKPAKLAALATATALAALLVGAGASSASATAAEHLKLTFESGVGNFTQPSTDGFDDSIKLDYASNRSGTVKLSVFRLNGAGGATFAPGDPVELTGSGTTWTGSSTFTDGSLTVGEWQVSAKINGVTEIKDVRIGSGVATSVKVTTTPSKVFVNSSDAPHVLTPHVVARDEIGTSLPILAGTLKYADAHGGNPVSESVESASTTSAGATAATIDVAGNHSGAATIKVSGIQGPRTSSHGASGSEHPTLSVAKLTSAKLVKAYPTMYPQASVDESSETVTVHLVDNAGITLPLENSKLTISQGSTVAASWDLSDTASTTETWDGMSDSSYVYGTYLVKVSATIAGGNTITATTHIVVSPAVPVAKTVTKTYAGSVFTKTDLANSSKCKVSGSALACVSADGHSGDVFVLKSVPSSVLALSPQFGYQAEMQLQITDFLAVGGSANWQWGTVSEPYSAPISITDDGTFSDTQNADPAAKFVGLELVTDGAIAFHLTRFGVTYTYWAAP